MLKITLVRSYIGVPEKLRKVLRSLGLRKIGQSTIKKDIPAVRGMINKVPHLIKVEKIED
ncbi:MAG TPA: 50S ribosomal protein L30 [Nitrospirae bacterium]|nr:50S ribosomal protein L30 [Nitrospirota bacterium]